MNATHDILAKKVWQKIPSNLSPKSKKKVTLSLYSFPLTSPDVCSFNQVGLFFRICGYKNKSVRRLSRNEENFPPPHAIAGNPPRGKKRNGEFGIKFSDWDLYPGWGLIAFFLSSLFRKINVKPHTTVSCSTIIKTKCLLRKGGKHRGELRSEVVISGNQKSGKEFVSFAPRLSGMSLIDAQETIWFWETERGYSYFQSAIHFDHRRSSFCSHLKGNERVFQNIRWRLRTTGKNKKKVSCLWSKKTINFEFFEGFLRLLWAFQYPFCHRCWALNFYSNPSLYQVCNFLTREKEPCAHHEFWKSRRYHRIRESQKRTNKCTKTKKFQESQGRHT